jgi:GntR family transcriptional regulator / MocR family aminotransferase
MKKSVAGDGSDGPRIFEIIRDRILSGALPAAAPVSSPSRLAREMEAARSSAADALDQLVAEGYLVRGPGTSYSVAGGAAFRRETIPDASPPDTERVAPFRFDLIDFRPGVPDLGRFPMKLWQRIEAETWRTALPLDLSYGQPEGRLELRREIARHLCAHRGVICQPEQITITSGSTQALGIVIGQLITGARPSCIVEDPGASETRRIASAAGARVTPVPVDELGMRTDALPPRARPAFLHVTPSHQFPLGSTLPAPRRAQLLRFARSRASFIIEEDLDGDYRYDSPPVSSLQGLCPARVIYVGTFSMTVFPALRVGFIVAPPRLVAGMRAAKRLTDVHTAAAPQLALARFMKDGHFERHVASMRKAYRSSREILLDALQRHFAEEARVLGSASGLHVCVRFPGIRFTPTLLNRIELAGVGVYPVEDHAVRKGHWEDTLVFGFGMLDPRRINTGIAILKRCLPAS